jgi:hypothetical protein
MLLMGTTFDKSESQTLTDLYTSIIRKPYTLHPTPYTLIPKQVRISDAGRPVRIHALPPVLARRRRFPGVEGLDLRV